MHVLFHIYMYYCIFSFISYSSVIRVYCFLMFILTYLYLLLRIISSHAYAIFSSVILLLFYHYIQCNTFYIFFQPLIVVIFQKNKKTVKYEYSLFLMSSITLLCVSFSQSCSL